MNQNQIKVFEYENKQVEFDLSQENIMVNATEMAKIFDARVENFTRIESTKSFLKAALKNAEKRFLGVEKEEDLIITKQKSGTWMHRVLALKFAAWLNPDFEVWVYTTIDKLLFGELKQYQDSLKETARSKNRLEELQESLRKNPEFLELEQLAAKIKVDALYRSKINRQQLDMFKEQIN